MKLPLAALALALTLAGTAGAEEVSAKMRPAKPTSVTYEEAIRCQAFYVVYASLLERGTDEYETAADMFDNWYDFSASYYPTGFDQNHDADVEAEVQRIDGELGNAAGQDAAQAILTGYYDACYAIRDS